MKAILISLMLTLMLATVGYSQVGIGTLNPTASLDVNGNMKIRTVAVNATETVAKDSILSLDRGVVNRISSRSIIESHFKTFIRGGFTSGSDINITISSGIAKLQFNDEDYDENNEYNTSGSSYEFIAKNSGLYAIDVQIKGGSTIAVSLDFGVAIMKTPLATGIPVILAKQSFANIGLLGINVTPPVRFVRTVVKLLVGDKIYFNVSNSLSLGLISAKEESFFTIQQVR